MRIRYRVEARVQRGAHPSTTWVVEPRVKPGKAQRVVDRTAIELAEREAVPPIMPSFDWGEDSQDDIAPVTVRCGIITIVVRATPVEVHGA